MTILNLLIKSLKWCLFILNVWSHYQQSNHLTIVRRATNCCIRSPRVAALFCFVWCLTAKREFEFEKTCWKSCKLTLLALFGRLFRCWTRLRFFCALVRLSPACVPKKENNCTKLLLQLAGRVWSRLIVSLPVAAVTAIFVWVSFSCEWNEKKCKRLKRKIKLYI